MVQPAQVQVIRQIRCMLWWLPRQLVMGSAGQALRTFPKRALPSRAALSRTNQLARVQVVHSACCVFGVSIFMLHAM